MTLGLLEQTIYSGSTMSAQHKSHKTIINTIKKVHIRKNVDSIVNYCWKRFQKAGDFEDTYQNTGNTSTVDEQMTFNNKDNFTIKH